MKAGIFIAAALVQIAAAQPAHRHAHAHVHEKKQVYVTDISYQTVTAATPDVVVYVDAAGNPVSTSTVGAAAPATTYVAPPATSESPVAVVATSEAPAPVASSPAPVVSSAVASSYEAPAASYVAPTTQAAAVTPAAASFQAAAKSSTSAAKPAASSASSSGGALSFGHSGGLSGTGIVYSAYTASGACKTQQQVDQDFAQLGPKGYGLVRIYGTDCGQVSTVGSAVKQYGMKLMVGIFSLGDLASEIGIIQAASNGDYSYIDTISIGNELVNSGAASAAQVVAAVGQARGLLSAAGYTGKVVTVDTFVAVLANPSLCEASDYAAINAHPFFDSTLVPSASGTWLQAQKALVAAACPGKNVIVTETGFPWGGNCDGSMCPSYANQATAISSIESAFPDGGFIILSAYNDLWKQNNQWTFNAEQSWGLYGNCPSA